MVAPTARTAQNTIAVSEATHLAAGKTLFDPTTRAERRSLDAALRKLYRATPSN